MKMKVLVMTMGSLTGNTGGKKQVEWVAKAVIHWIDKVFLRYLE